MLQYVFNGQIDEVALYKRYLNADERTWLFNSGNSRSYSEVTGNTLAYGDPSHDHAATALAGNNYVYDANGNMTQRVIGADTYLLGYDAENRLVQVQKNSVVVASFTYDADGKRVKSVMDGDTTLFVGAHYEVKNGNQITKYYFAGSSRVAMRTYTVPQNNMTLTYLMGDQLGSTSLAVNAATGEVIETRYKAWGEVRYVTPNVTLPTRNTFTGQYSYVADEATDLGSSGFGLMFYQSRWYDPSLGRMAQADTIVPGGVQGLDRYAYVNNSPLNYVDPSGHVVQGRCNYLKNYMCEGPGQTTQASNNNPVCSSMYCNPAYYQIAPAPSNWSNENQSWWYNMQKLGILGKKQAAMDYVTASECAGDVCDPVNTQLFRAMTHRYNAFCSGNGSAWSVKCVQTFWGYIEGIRNAYEDNFTRTTSTENMAAAILGGNGASFGGFTNDGKGCLDADANQLCGWGNLTTVQAGAFRDKFFSGWQDGCAQSSESQDCNLESDYNSIWIHYQADEGHYTHFIVMALWVDQTYCSAGWCN